MRAVSRAQRPLCAHPYVVHLLQLTRPNRLCWRDHLLAGDKSDMPGMVRASFGC
jgi:hypothetical protein